VTARRRLASLAVVALLGCSAGFAVACGDDEETTGGPVAGGEQGNDPADTSGPIRRDPANGKVTLTIGSKNFTEQRVLGELYAQGLEAAGYKVRRHFGFADEQAAQRALEGGEVDGYPEYTGTALLSLCGVASADVPKDPEQAYRDARDCLKERGETAFSPTPFTSSNEVGVTRATANKYDLRTISDLKAHEKEFTLYGSPECRHRQDCLLGLQGVYGLRFNTFTAVPTSQRFAVLRNRGPIASIVFTTDPQIGRQNVVLLEDDRGMFPPYNSIFVARDEVVQNAGPALGRTILQIEQSLTDETMQELNARVDLDKRSPANVAEGYLRQAGLVSG
jgi:osmoprotectant transport system substrate-binding protein